MFKKAFGTFTEAVKASTAAFTDDQQTSRNVHQQQHQSSHQKSITKSSSGLSTTSNSSTDVRKNYADVELDLSGLSEEEKAIIMSINAKAAMVEEGKVDVREESRRHYSLSEDSSTTKAESSSYGRPTTQKDNNKQLDELSKEKREHIESVTNKANDEESTNLSSFGNKLLKSSPLGKMAEKLITNETAKETFKQLSNVKSDFEKNYGKMMEKAENLKKSDPTQQDQSSKISPSSSVHSGDFLEKFEEAGGEFSKKMVKKLNIGQNLHKLKESDVFAQATGAFDKFSHFVTDSAPPTVSQQQVDLSGVSEEEAAQILSVMAKADQLMDSQQQQHQKSIFDENLRQDAKKLTSLATKSSKEAFSFLKDSMSNIVDSALDVKAKSSGSKFDTTPTKDTKWFHESIQDDKEYQPEEPAVETTAAEDTISPRSSSQETEGADENNEEDLSSQASDAEPAKLQEDSWTPVPEEVYLDNQGDVPQTPGRVMIEPQAPIQSQPSQIVQQFEYNVGCEDNDQKDYYRDDDYDKDEYIQYCYEDENNIEYTQTAVPIVVCPPTPMPPHLSDKEEESAPPESPQNGEPWAKRDANIYAYESPPVSDESDRELSYLRDDVLLEKNRSKEDFREDSSDEDERATASGFDAIEAQRHLFEHDESETFSEVQGPSSADEEKVASLKSSLQYESSVDTYFKPYTVEDPPYSFGVEEINVERRHSSSARPRAIETEVDSHHRRSLPDTPIDSHTAQQPDNVSWSQRSDYSKLQSISDRVKSCGSESSYETEDTGYISNTSPFEDENKDFAYEPSSSQVAIPDTIVEDDVQHPNMDQEDYHQRAASFNPFLSEDVDVSRPAAPDIPGFPDLDLSSFNEEERQHLIAMFCKASELDKEVEHRAVVQPNVPVTTSTAQARQKLSLDVNSVPVIKEIQPTPEPLYDDQSRQLVGEKFDEISQTPLAMPQHQQQYDSSEVSSDVNDDEEELRRINEIEMELSSKERQAREVNIVKTCPLCLQNPIEFVKDDLENLTGQKCGYCSSVVCTQCGHVCSVPLGGNDYTSLWLCRKCADRSDATVVQGRQAQSFLEKINGAEMKIVEDHDHYSIRSSTLINEEFRYKSQRQTIKIASSGGGDFDSDESDEEIDTSDDDYPDEVIEVPPVVNDRGQNAVLDEETSRLLVEKQDDEYGSDVLAEISKTFAAGQSFDVDEMYKKSKNILISQKSLEKMAAQTGDQKQSTNPFDQCQIPPPPIPARSMVNQPLPFPAYQPKASGGKFEQDIHIYDDDLQFEGNGQQGGDPSSPKTYHHTNLDYEEINESPKEPRGPINEDQVDTGSNAEEEIDYAQAMRYYNSQPFYTHRSGPVYTIPEDEEENEEVKATTILPRASSTTTTGKETLSTLESSNEQQHQPITRSQSSASTERVVAPVVGSLATLVTATTTSMDIPSGMKPSSVVYKDITSVVPSNQYFEAYKSVQSSDSVYQVAGRSVQAVISTFPSVIPPAPPPPQQYAISSSNDNVAPRGDALSSIYRSQGAITGDLVDSAAAAAAAADQVISKLKRSPAMILHSNGTPISGPEQCLPRLAEQSHDFNQAKMTVKKDDQAISKIAEMGRRKLPNIPQGMQSSTSQLMSTEDYGHQRQWRSASDASFLESEPTAAGSPSSTVLFRPQSSLEIQQQQHQQPATDRAGLVRCKSVPGKGAPLFSGAKIPVTLARVLLKQELREALLRRSVQLEACEIEANQRQYNIHRHLLTGVYPRSVGLDSVPAKIKCSLPQQLVEGCHIEYKKPTSSSTTMLASSSKYAEYTTAPVQRSFSASMQTLPYRSSLSTTATANDYFTRVNASTQFDASINASQSKRLVTGSSQTFAPDDEVYKSVKTTARPLSYSNLSPKLKDADTQTKTFINAASSASFDNWAISYADYFRRRSSAAYGMGARSVGTSTSDVSVDYKKAWALEGRMENKQIPRTETTSTNTEKQTDQYLDSRKSRKHQKHRKAISAMDYFSDEDDDDQLTREIRKSKILGEIERRREKLLKQSLPYGAGYSSLSFDSRIGDPGASDYSSHIPHYGSLPRMDSYNRYGQDYGSLPRAGGGYDPYSVYGTLGSRQKVHPMYHSDLGYLSDLQDYGIGDRMRDNRDGTMNTPNVSYDTYGQRFASRSLPYLDQLDRYNSDPLRSAQKTVPAPVASSTPRYQPESGFLSQYANYLNEQFLNRPLDDPNVWNSPAAAASVQSTSAYGPSQYMASNYESGLTPNIRNYPVPQIQTAQYGYPQEAGLGSNSLRSYQNLGPSSTLSRLSSGWSASPYEQRLMDTYNYDLRPQPRSNAPASSYPSYQYSRSNVSSSAPTLLPDVGYNTGLGQQYPASRTYQQQQYPDVEMRRQNGCSYSGQSLYSGPLNLGRQDYTGPTDINDLYRRTGSAPLQQSVDYQNVAQYQMQSAQSKGQLNQHIIGRTSTPRTTWQEGRPIITSDPMRLSGAAPILGGPIDLQSQQPLSYNVHNVPSCSRNVPSTANARFQTKQPNRAAIKRILLTRDPKDKYSKGGGLGMKIIGGKISPTGELVAYVARIYDRGLIGTLEEVREGDQILEWNGVPLTGKTYEEVQAIINESYGEIEIIINSGANLHRNQSTSKPAVMPTADSGYVSTGLLDGKASPCFSSTPPHHQAGLQTILLKQQQRLQSQEPITGELCVRVTFEEETGTLFVNVQSARNLKPISKTQSPNAFVKIYLLPRRIVENKRRTKFVPNNRNPDWNQTAVYKDLTRDHLRDSFLEFTVWHLDQTSLYGNEFLGQVVLSLSEPMNLANIPKWYLLSSQMLRSHRQHR